MRIGIGSLTTNLTVFGNKEHTNIFVYGQDLLTQSMEVVHEGVKKRHIYSTSISMYDLTQ